MDIEEEGQQHPSLNRASENNANHVNYIRLSSKNRMSNQSMLSFPDKVQPIHSAEKISLESNISEKIRRQQNQKGLFQELLDKDENGFYINRDYGSYKYKSRMSENQRMINQDNIQRASEKMSIEQPPQIKEQQKLSCKCSKSKCLLMYCQCFSKGVVCNQTCSCYQCRNSQQFEDKRQKARMTVLERDPNAFTNKLQMIGGEQLELAYKRGCNCKKTKCFKKYCECYNSGVKCTYLCNCENCLNGGQNTYKE